MTELLEYFVLVFLAGAAILALCFVFYPVPEFTTSIEDPDEQRTPNSLPSSGEDAARNGESVRNYDQE